MRNSMKQIMISTIVMLLGLSSIGFGQKEFIIVNERNDKQIIL